MSAVASNGDGRENVLTIDNNSHPHIEAVYVKIERESDDEDEIAAEHEIPHAVCNSSCSKEMSLHTKSSAKASEQNQTSSGHIEYSIKLETDAVSGIKQEPTEESNVEKIEIVLDPFVPQDGNNAREENEMSLHTKSSDKASEKNQKSSCHIEYLIKLETDAVSAIKQEPTEESNVEKIEIALDPFVLQDGNCAREENDAPPPQDSRLTTQDEELHQRETTKNYCADKNITPDHGFCDYSITDHPNLNDADEIPYSCSVCDYKCTKKTDYTRHLRRHTGEKPYSCSVCDYKCAIKSNFTRHMRRHTGVKPYSCSVCKYECAIKSNFTRHMRTHVGEKPEKKYSCPMCEHKCAKKSYLKIHLMTHTGEKPFSCNECDYKSAVKTSLIQHMRTHTGERPFPCSLCEYRGNTRSNLKNHQMIHTDEKPYSCSICQYKCRQKIHLTEHLKTHTAKKPIVEKLYTCTLCTYKSKLKTHFETHLRKHSGEKPFTCSVCEYKCTTKTNLKIHQRTHTDEKPFCCAQCAYKCRQRAHLIQHLRKHT